MERKHALPIESEITDKFLENLNSEAKKSAEDAKKEDDEKDDKKKD